MLTQRSIIAHRIYSSPSNRGGIFRQYHSKKYSKPSFIPTDRKSTTPTPAKSPTVTSETQELQDKSQIATRSHVYYETYRTAGFEPSVYTAPPQPKSAKKLPNADFEKKKTIAEYTCCITTYNHAYYKEFSIAGFKPIRTSAPTQPDPANQVANQPVQELGKGPTNKPTGEPSSTGREAGGSRALPVAATYISFVPMQETKTNQDCSGLDHDIETCAQTIEELEFETLGITGFQRTHDETGNDELKTEVDDGKVGEQSVRSSV